MNISKLTLVDKCFGLVVLLVITQLYRVVGVLLGLNSVATITAAITVVCAMYLVIKRRLLYKTIHYYWFFALAFAFPILTAVYAPGPDLRSIGTQLHYFLLLLASAVFFSKIQKLAFVFLAAGAAVSVLGMVLSILRPELFEPMARIASAQHDYLGRGAGFFLQPNLLAYNLILMALMMAYFTPASQGRRIIALSALLVMIVIFTGSRGGMITAVIFGVSWIVGSGQLRSRRSVSLIFLSLGLLIALLPSVLPMLSLQGNGGLYLERIASIFAGDITHQGSMAERIEYQVRFLEMIANKPVLGYGIGSIVYLQDTGGLLGAAHNQFLDLLVQYGVVGFAMFLVGGGLVVRRVTSTSGSLTAWGFACSIVAVMLGTNMLFDMQNFYLLLGIILSKSIHFETGRGFDSRGKFPI